MKLKDFKKEGLLLGALLLSAFFAVQAAAGDSVALSYGYVDDGGCPKAGHTVQATYTHASEGMDVYASVRSAPSGGDCTVDGLSYNLEAERRFAVTDTISGLVKFQAEEHSTSAPYAIVDENGRVITRGDGQAASPVTLPAGKAQTIAGILGASFSVGVLNIDLGYNLVPIDWADGSSGRTAHVAASAGFDLPVGRLGLMASLDKGNGSFGETRATLDVPIKSGFSMAVSVSRIFGLNEIDGGEPATQEFAGLPAVLAGAPQDTATFFSVGLSYDI